MASDSILTVNRALLLLLLSVSCCAPPARAAESTAGLKVLPAPKEVRMLEGKFAMQPSIDILITHPEDGLAAETLRDEVLERSGVKLAIATATAAPKTSIQILLGRLADRNIQRYLQSADVRTGTELGDQGYVLRVTAGGVLAAASSGQGVFYAVQTLRQLLHSEGKSLYAPALVIRDWPSMEWRGVQDDISRGPIPTLDYLKKQVRTLAEYKINLLALNMEHVFDFQ